MSFDKEYFDNINERMAAYFANYPAGMVSLVIRTTYGQDYNVVKFIELQKKRLCFAYFAAGVKTRKLSDKVRETTGESTAFPALTLPYSAVAAVEFNPGGVRAEDKTIGFRKPTGLSR